MTIFAQMKLKLAIYFCLFSLASFGQQATREGNVVSQQADSEGSLVKWMTYQEAMIKYKTQPRPIIMDFYTDWCGWCKHMMKTTYADANISSYINAYFYPVKFDAEGKDTIEYLGVKYFPASNQPRTPHPLAVKLLQNKLMYPTTLFLNGLDQEKNEYKFSMIAAGFLEAQKLEPILIFSLEGAYRNSGYDDFNNGYQKAFYDTTINEKIKQVEWKQPVDVFTKEMKTEKKKMIFLGNYDWCNSCKVEKRSTFTDSVNMAYISKKFDLIEFNPTIKDTLYYKGKVMVNPGTVQIPYHSLAFELCHGSLSFPSLVILNEENEIVDAIPSFINSVFLNQIAHFYGEDVYKVKSWKDFTTGTGK